MTDNIARVSFPTRGDRFGGCPTCGMTNGYINDGPEHWFVCDRHKAKWLAGSNLFSSWRDETPEEQFKSRDLLSRYRTVEAA